MHQKKYQNVNLLELILVKNVIIQIMKLLEYKHLLVSLKIKTIKLEKESNKKMKELEYKIKTLNLQLTSQITQ